MGDENNEHFEKVKIFNQVRYQIKVYSLHILNIPLKLWALQPQNPNKLNNFIINIYYRKAFVRGIK